VDSYLLQGPNGTVINLGSWIVADAGQLDFGARDLIKALYAENAAAEGGVLAFETANVRRMVFPVRLASSAFLPTGGLAGIESAVRLAARPGAVIDLMPEGVATGDAVRFDVLAGRYEESFDLRISRAGRRDGLVKLDVMPFGYLPTTILLASVASIGLPGVLAIPNASIFGDVPGLARVVIQPSSPTGFGGATWLPDRDRKSVV
jgi:hypothetical protein